MSLSIPPVLLPIFGFKGCTLPTLELEVFKIKEGNYEFPRKVIKSANVSSITLEQGVSLFNSDFYDWIRKAIQGQTPPKTLLIVQFTRINPAGSSGNFVGPPPHTVFGKGIALEAALRLPGRAWLCHECRPVKYIPGSNLDANSYEVSIASLEVEIEEFEEVSLGL